MHESGRLDMLGVGCIRVLYRLDGSVRQSCGIRGGPSRSSMSRGNGFLSDEGVCVCVCVFVLGSLSNRADGDNYREW